MRRSNPEISCLRPRSAIRQLPISPAKSCSVNSPLRKARTTTESATGALNSSMRSSARAGLLRELEWRNPA